MILTIIDIILQNKHDYANILDIFVNRWRFAADFQRHCYIKQRSIYTYTVL